MFLKQFRRFSASALAVISLVLGSLVVQSTPASAAIGDIVKLSTSAPVAGGKLWRGVYSNSTGSTLYAVPQGDGIFRSTDYGATWTQLTGAGTHQWFDISVSADGTKLAATDGNVVGGYIYTSSDSGVTWTQRTGPGLHYWHSIDMSSDGTHLVATSSTLPTLTGYIATSSDSGATWTLQTALGDQVWLDASLSDDGTKIAAVVQGGDIWTSTDFGANWTDRSSAGNRSWYQVSSSSDGTKVAATAYSGSVYVSLDSGATWAAKTPGTPTHLMSVAYSPDGSTLLVGDFPGDLYSSTDDGTTWTDQTAAGSKKWYTLAMNTTGTRLIAGIYGFPFGGDIWGTAVPTGPAFSSSTLSIPDTNVGSTSVSQTLTITNTGTAALTISGAATLSGANAGDFTITSDSCATNSPIAPSGTCTVTFTFTPSASGTRTANLVFSDTGATGSPHTVTLTGTGLAPTFTGVAPTIPNTTVGSASVTQTVTVTNTGNANLAFSAAATKSGTNPGDFVVIADNCFANSPIAPSGTCTVTFTFNPTAGGTRSADLVFTDNASGSPHSVALSATGLAASVSYVLTPFPDTTVYQTSPIQTLTVTNVGNLDLVFGAAAALLGGTNSGSYTIISDGCSSQTLAPAATCMITVSFHPTTAGPNLADLSLTSNDPTSPTVVSLTGKGLRSEVRVDGPKPDAITSARVTVTPKESSLLVELTYGGSKSNSPTLYTVVASPSGNSCTIQGANGSCTILGLDPNQQYTVVVVAGNIWGSSPAYISNGKYSPLGAAKVTKKASYNLTNFKGDSAKLTSKLKARIKAFIQKHPTLNHFYCTGFTAGKPVLNSDKKLAKARAMAVCSYILKLRPSANVTQSGKTPGAPFGARYRKVVISAFEVAS